MNSQLKTVLEQQFFNKKITVPVPARNDYGKIIPNKFQHCTGTCTYIGDNQYLKWDIQVTIDRMPIKINHINDIVLTPTSLRIRK